MSRFFYILFCKGELPFTPTKYDANITDYESNILCDVKRFSNSYLSSKSLLSNLQTRCEVAKDHRCNRRRVQHLCRNLFDIG